MIIGQLTGHGLLNGSVSTKGLLNGSVSVSGGNNKPYTGNYVVEPVLDNDQVLPTTGKIMLDDVTVLKVPVYKTKNATGGYTVYVAERIDE